MKRKRKTKATIPLKAPRKAPRKPFRPGQTVRLVKPTGGAFKGFEFGANRPLGSVGTIMRAPYVGNGTVRVAWLDFPDGESHVRPHKLELYLQTKEPADYYAALMGAADDMMA